MVSNKSGKPNPGLLSMEEQMNDILKKIEKVKSFDKRASFLYNADPMPTGEDLNACLRLIVEKAKYGEHFAQIAWVCEIKKIANREVLLACENRATEHPSQAAKVARAFFMNGYIDDGKRYWDILLNRYREEPSYYAQILSVGRWFPEVREDALKRIEDFKRSPDWAEYGDMTEEQDAPMYINF
jgi:hypothetical protein